jgi:hypothetical protein
MKLKVAFSAGGSSVIFAAGIVERYYIRTQSKITNRFAYLLLRKKNENN